MSVIVKTPKKLIEVALPLELINEASIREGYIYRGNPSSVHKWWAQRPLAAARAVIFAQLVNDPSWKWEFEHPGEVPPANLKASWAASRKRLFNLIRDLVRWENMNDPVVISRARQELQRSWVETCELNKNHPRAGSLFNPEIMPALHDPFAGGGTIPLEAKRLGIETYSSDLNPLAVLINKALLVLPDRFSGKSPVGPVSGAVGDQICLEQDWPLSAGLAEDVRRYARGMLEKAKSRIGEFYPSITISKHLASGRADLQKIVGEEVSVIAYLWARTVRSPSPAFRNVNVPLIANFVISSKSGNEVYISPKLSNTDYEFVLVDGEPPSEAKQGTKLGRANFRCIMSNAAIGPDYIKSEGLAGRIGRRLMAVVVESRRGRFYLPPTPEQEAIAEVAQPSWLPEGDLAKDPRAFTPILYGLTKWSQLYLPRQISAITTFIDILSETHSIVENDYKCSANFRGGSDPENLGAQYADIICTYLSFAIDKHAMYGNSLVPWYGKENRPSMLFTQQVIQMTWDFCEVNPLSSIGGSFIKSSEIVASAIESLPVNGIKSVVSQKSALDKKDFQYVFVSTDPPYYDNVPYADLSDFFYSWIRPALKNIHPELFGTMNVPKSEELVAATYRQGGKEKAEAFFLDGMTSAMHILSDLSHPAAPITIYYAFKQSETREGSTTSTGWVTFLSAVVRAGLSITGTWPIRTERKGRARDSGSNALASSIILVCRHRASDAVTVSRRAFLSELNRALPVALDEMTRGDGGDQSPVAPVDLSQSIIGPGMAIFSKYAAVLEADGTPMSVETALRLINKFLADDDFDADTQFCLHWFEQHGWAEGPFGEADQLARAKGTAVNGLVQAGVVEAGRGKVRLFRPAEFQADWTPEADDRLPVWEVLHQLIRLFQAGGDSAAGATISAVAAKADGARQLAYRLYTLCERAGWAEDARPYNDIMTGWSAIVDAGVRAKPRQTNLFDA